MINEAGLKQAAAREYENQKMAQGFTGASSIAPECTKQPMREGFVARFRGDLSRSRNASRRANDLEELLCLLDKNPEIARILDLVDALGNKY